MKAYLFYQRLTGNNDITKIDDAFNSIQPKINFKKAKFSRVQWFFFQSMNEPHPFLRARDMRDKLYKNLGVFSEDERNAINSLVCLLSPFLKIDKLPKSLNKESIAIISKHFTHTEFLRLKLLSVIDLHYKLNVYNPNVSKLADQVKQSLQ